MSKMSSKIDAKTGIEKSRFRGGPNAKEGSELVGRRGVRGEVNLSPGGRRFGREAEKTKGRKEEGKEDLKKGG